MSVPQSHPVSLPESVVATAASDPSAVLFRRRTPAGLVDVTASRFADDVSRLAGAMVAAGVRPGDRVVLLCRTRYEWTLTDYAIWTAGAVTVPVYESSSAEQVAWILEDSAAALAVVETSEQVELVRPALSSALQQVWEVGAGDLDARMGSVSEADVRTARERSAALTPDDLASLVYTSGTTGRPKGCMLTHGNMIAAVEAGHSALPELFTRGESTVLFLPLAHVFARLVQCASVAAGVTIVHSDPSRLVADLAEVSPTFVVSVPRVFEKVHAAAATKAEAAGKERIFSWAERTAIAWSESLDSSGPSLRLRLAHAVADRLVYRKLRASLGGNLSRAVSGGAPLGVRLGHFFRGAGIPIFEGYGLTETSACTSINSPAASRIGSVGRPVPGTSVRIAEDGEILQQGPSVFSGYWGNRSATEEVLVDGWFHTGDLGSFDEDGFLRITGRKKEIIVTAGGKNVAPAQLEDLLRAHPLVSQAMVVGDQKPYVAALVTLDAEAVRGWAERTGRPSSDPAALADDAELLAQVQSAVDRANASVSKAEAIKRFTVLPVDFTEDSGHLTPTMKLKRSVVMEDFRDQVEALYSPSR